MPNEITSLLMLDDSEADFKRVRACLDQLPKRRYTLEWASTPPQALELLAQRHFDILLLDDSLSPTNGLAFWRDLRARGFTIPMILLTSLKDEALEQQAITEGASDYFAKDQLNAENLERTLRYVREHSKVLAALRASEQRITHLYKQEQERNLKLLMVYEITAAAAVLDADQLLERACRLLTEQFGYYKVNLGRVDETTIRIEQRHRSIDGQNPDLSRPPVIIPRTQTSLMTQAVNQARVIFAPNVTEDPNYLPETGTLAKAEVAIPILSNNQAIGVLDVQSNETNGLTDDDVLLLSLLASHLGKSLENARLFQAILDERSSLQALIASSRDGILLVGPRLRLLVANRPALAIANLPGTPEKWMACSFLDLLHALRSQAPEAARQVIAEARRIRQGEEDPREGDLTLGSRKAHWLSLPVFAGKTPMGRLLVLRDVTEEHLITEMRAEFTHTIVHDLRSPLTAISLSLQLLEEETENFAPNQHRVLEVARNNTHRMLTLIDNILDVNQLEVGQFILRREQVFLDQLIHESISAHSPFLADKEIDLQRRIPASLPPTLADARIIERVMQNLLDNAIKFSPGGSVITVTLTAHAEPPGPTGDPGPPFFQVSISDQGPGIPPEIQSRLFQKFVTGKQVGRGSGLGLTFCKRAVEAHGGKIWVASAPETGTTFTFTLPVLS